MAATRSWMAATNAPSVGIPLMGRTMSDDRYPDGGISYTANGQCHVVLEPTERLNENDEERVSTVCGARVPPKTLALNGLRLTEEYRKGKLCETCVERLQERDVTIPGFISDGEVIPRV